MARKSDWADVEIRLETGVCGVTALQSEDLSLKIGATFLQSAFHRCENRFLFLENLFAVIRKSIMSDLFENK